jgi:hypothetical protein
MTSSAAISLRTIVTRVALVGVAVLLVGCASVAPVTQVPVSDLKSVAGTWKGVAHWRGAEADVIELTIREDGTYDVLSRQSASVSRGKGKVELSGGRLILQGERGRGVGTVLRSPSGDRVLDIDATLSDNYILSVRLWPSS